MTSPPAYLAGVRVVPERLSATDEHPYNLPFLPTLDLAFTSAVTMFVGENGSGKSTLLEAHCCSVEVPGRGRSADGSRRDSCARRRKHTRGGITAAFREA